MEKVLHRAKIDDKRYVYSIEMTNNQFIEFELTHNSFDSRGICISWDGILEHPILGMILLYSSSGTHECSIVRVIYRGRSYNYSDRKWQDAKELVQIAKDFADDLLNDVYTGDEFLLHNQDLPDD